MINDKTQKQESGDNSTNYQATNINQYGISYRDAKEIAIDVFKANFLTLKDEARQIAEERAEFITNSVLEKLQESNPQLLESFKEPSLQSALYSAQKGYVISGEQEVGKLLVDILVDRANQQERNLRQIVLDESLEVAPKLTINQLDSLTLIFTLKYTMNFTIVDLESFKNYLEKYIQPFTQGLTKELSCYQHLEYCNCSSISLASAGALESFLHKYRGLFCKGLTNEELENSHGDLSKFGNMLIPSLHDKNKLQVRAMDEKVIEKEAKKQGISDENISHLKQVFQNSFMSHEEVSSYIKAQGEFMEKLFDYWDNSEMKSMTLTSVGIALAQANFKRKTGLSYDLSIWIK